MPIITVVLSGEGYPIRQLTDYADDVIKERLRQVSGVGGVKILGGREREIRVWVDPARLEGATWPSRTWWTPSKTERRNPRRAH
ncbi:efflux RND transporter permease subunit [bacterium]|nr:efflux RND transporter permease subunit [bacterium]